MMGVKQMKFCGAVARALLIGVDKTCNGAVLSESKRKEFLPLLLDFA